MDELLSRIEYFVSRLGGAIWGAPMALLLIGTGLYLSCRLGWVQIRHFGDAMRGTVGRLLSPGEGGGDVTPFQAMSTALAGTMGTGNIAGVALAVSLGGPGAIFWLWVTAIPGMATKFAEVVLSVRYRERNAAGEWAGGPMYYIKNGLGRRWMPLARVFALAGALAALGMGNAVQVSELAGAVNSALEVFAPASGLGERQVSAIVGLAAALCSALVLIGGAKRLGAVAGMLVPAAGIAYILACLAVIVARIDALPHALWMIIRGAFEPESVAAGLSLRLCVDWGVRRGVFSNEAGLGSAPIAHATTSERQPVRQGFYGIFEVFADTMVVCTLTGMTLLVSGVGIDYGEAQSAPLCADALGSVLGERGGELVVAGGMCLFALSTLFSWGLYGSRCCEFLLGARSVRPYLAVFCAAAFFGAVAGSDIAWPAADALNGLMALPNLAALLALAPEAARETRAFFAREKG